MGPARLLGQTRPFRDARSMSSLPPTPDISGPGRHFAFVPLPDITQAPRTIEGRTPWAAASWIIRRTAERQFAIV